MAVADNESVHEEYSLFGYKHTWVPDGFVDVIIEYADEGYLVILSESVKFF